MTKLQQRLRRHRRKQARRVMMRATLKTLAWRSSALLLIFSMLLSIVKLPLAYAYFSTESAKESDGLTFLVHKEADGRETNANLALHRPFLFEEEDLGEMEMGTFGVMSMDSGLNLDAGRSFKADDLQTKKNTEIRQPIPGETVEAEITVEDDFDVEDIFVPSVKLHYEDKFSFALSGEIIDAVLVATFDFYTIWNWFEDLNDVPDNVTLTVSGEGYIKDGSIFFFAGETTIPLKGKYDIREVVIVGPDVLFVPLEETVSRKYKLFDQNGSKLTGVDWQLETGPAAGIILDEQTGELSITKAALEDIIVLEASLESQGRLHIEQKEIQIYEAPQLEILGAEKITVPLPGESVIEFYELLVPHTFMVEEVEWSVSEDVIGIEVNNEGWITVFGEARGEKMTLTANTDILETPFTIQKEVELEIIQIASVQVEGEISHITVPDYEPLSAFYTALVYGPDGEELPDEPVTWHLEPQNQPGITLSGTGELIVDPSADSTDLTLNAVSVRAPSVNGTFNISVEKVVEKVEQRTSSPNIPAAQEPFLNINGEDFILIPETDALKTFKYSATSGQDFSVDELTWTLKEKIEGVTLDAASGLLTIKGSAPEGSVTLLVSAPSPVDGADEGEAIETTLLEGRKIITLAHPAVTSIEISDAPSTVTIPDPAESDGAEITFQLSAVLLDQKGNPLPGEVAWHLDGSPSGVYLDENGFLAVGSGAEEGAIMVTASAEGITVDVYIELLTPDPAEKGGSGSPKEEDDQIGIKPEDEEDDGEGKDDEGDDEDGEEDGEEPDSEPEDETDETDGSDEAETDPAGPPDEEAVIIEDEDGEDSQTEKGKDDEGDDEDGEEDGEEPDSELEEETDKTDGSDEAETDPAGPPDEEAAIIEDENDDANKDDESGDEKNGASLPNGKLEADEDTVTNDDGNEKD